MIWMWSWVSCFSQPVSAQDFGLDDLQRCLLRTTILCDSVLNCSIQATLLEPCLDHNLLARNPLPVQCMVFPSLSQSLLGVVLSKCLASLSHERAIRTGPLVD